MISLTSRKNLDAEHGMGYLGLAFGISILIGIICTLQTCIYEHKEAKVERRKEARREAARKRATITQDRGRQGYRMVR